MTTPQNTVTSPVPITVTASTSNGNDTGYQHCFEQNDDATLTFDVKTDLSIKTIHFVLWKLHDPDKPKKVKSVDCSVHDGQVTITISDPHPVGESPFEHLGPGPYCATLAASTSIALSDTSRSAGTIVGETVYYYETWRDNRDCRYAKLTTGPA
jgi:hypothetical protein